MPEAMARIAPSQPNEAMARIASRKKSTILLDLSCRVKISEKGFLDVDSKLFSKVQIDSK
jgi:predicted metalloenzyme YecM